MLRIDVDVDWESLATSQALLDGLPDRFVLGVLTRVARQLKRDAPKAFSVLANSGSQRMTGHGEGEVFFGTNYAWDLHEGRAAGPVAFQAIKDWVKVKGLDPRAAWPIAKSIERNGTVAQPWVRDFLESGQLNQMIKDAVAEESARAMA